jgi:glutathione synthase/RimK-type ligase-like ATP-grasp enzyme
MPTEQVVCKPPVSYGGRDIFIGRKTDAATSVFTYPVLLQEFVDTSAGIPGLTESHHDYRIILMNNEVLLTMIRTPPPGKIISNVMQGGTASIVPPDKRPDTPHRIAQEIDTALSQYGKRLYCIDCILGSDGEWKLLELNPEPGMMTPAELGPFADEYYRLFATFLLS